jgi:N-acetylglucosaminyldiphosphoundecaprenol N-acetyl-beta-D-mannosaminyltransferase
MNRSSRYFARTVVGGIAVDVCTESELVSTLVEGCSREHTEKPAKLVFDLNGQGLALCAFNSHYRRDLLQADIVHADGQPIVAISKYVCGVPIPERTATTDLIHALGKKSAAVGLRLYFLGASPETIVHAAARFRALYPDAHLVGFRDGYFEDNMLNSVVNDINACRPDIVFVGMGKPVEQRLAVKIQEQLNAAWIITAGGCFDFLANTRKRAPKWMQAYGFEWLYRLAQEPQRLFWRYAWTNAVSLSMLIFFTKRDAIPKTTPNR